MNTTTAFIAPAAGRPRRLHSAEFKAKVVDACGQSGELIAGIALANGINANLARRWVKASSTPRVTGQTGAVTSFVPVCFEPEPVSPSASDIHIEVRRSAGTVTVSWPTSAAAECGAWLREMLR